jgi:superfamily I DNA/RNA helicase
LGQNLLFDLKTPPEPVEIPLEFLKRPLPVHETEYPKKRMYNKYPLVTEKWNDLNEAQRRAVEHERGPVLVVAGPGTGKTQTLTRRIAYLITQKGVSPENILAVTFTNKAAEEMRQRLKAFVGNQVPLPTVGTFHSVCLQLLKEQDGENAPAVLDDGRRKALVREAIKQVNHGGRSISLTPDDALRRIVVAKQQFLKPGDRLEPILEGVDGSELRSVYGAYQNILSIEGLCDYEDLIFKVVGRVKKDPVLLKQYQERFHYIFVDEYQDLNQGQYRLIRALSPPRKDLFVIGDPDQSIYGFRGSNVEYFKRFIEDYPESEIVQLSRNYRSSKTILEASWQVIRDPQIGAPHSRLYSEIDGIKSIRVLELPSDKAEAVAVGRTIENLVGGTGFHSVDFGNVDTSDPSAHRSFSDVAIFYRTGAQAEVFVDVFDKSGIPYQRVSKDRLYYRNGVLDLVSFLKIIEESGAYVDLDILTQRIYPHITKETLEIFKPWGYRNNFKLNEALWHAKRIPIPEMSNNRQQTLCEFITWIEGMKGAVDGLTAANKIRHIVAHTPVQKIFADNPVAERNLNRLLDISQQYGHSTREFLASAALQTDTDIYDSRAETVSLMTMHAAKGLEFPIVFIVGCEDGFIPHHRSDTDPDEERRLFYVAMTRAREQLYLTSAKYRRIYGKRIARVLSPFVKDIEERLKSYETDRSKKPTKEKQTQLQLFS